MSAIGGSVQEMSVKNRIYPVTADSDVNVKQGGKENETQRNGDGTIRVLQTETSWSLDGASFSIDPDTDAFEFLQEVSDAGEVVPITITLASGAVYSGKGIIVGELAMSTASTSAPVAFQGEGKLTKL